jgi:hypothetical protein
MAAGPDVLFALTAGHSCSLAVAAAVADPPPALRLLPAVCDGAAAVLEPAGEAADGWMAIEPGHRATPAAPGEPGTFDHHLRELLARSGVAYQLDGPTDLLPVEMGVWRRWRAGSQDEPTGEWVQVAEVSVATG